MECDQVLARLNAYADGELSRFRSRKMTRHLAACPSCRGQLESLREVSRFLRDLPVPPVPEGLAAKVVAAANQRVPKAEFPSPTGRLTAWLAQGLQGMSVPVRLAACGTALAAVLVGVLVGGQMFPANRSPAVSAAAQELYGLEWFGHVPPVSVAAAYLTLPPTLSPAEGGAR